MLQRTKIQFTVGDVEHLVSVNDIGLQTTLMEYLREKVHLTGTKRMCMEGGCGACTVTVEVFNKILSVNSCLVPILSCYGWKIHTIESIGNSKIGYHPIQKTLAESNGTQCGYCSPGMVMNMFALQRSGLATKENIENSFGGNICRCTGYRPILQGFQELATDEECLPDIEEFKKCSNSLGISLWNEACLTRVKFFVRLTDNSKWVKVHTLKDLLEVLKIHAPENCMLVSGNTAKGVYKDDILPNFYIDIKTVSELTTYSVTQDMIKIGANLVLADFIKLCETESKTDGFSYLTTIAQHLDMVATVQIRNVGSLAGNLMIKHQHNDFNSDIFLLLETFNATIVMVDVSGYEASRSPKDFLKVDMMKKVIKSIVLKSLDDSYIYSTYKIMPRAQNAQAIVNAGFLVKITENIVTSANIVYGGINHATKTEKLLVGKPLHDNATLQTIFDSLYEELGHGLNKELAISLFYKFALKTCPTSQIGDRYRSGGETLSRALSTGLQEYCTMVDRWPLTQPIVKVESLAQTSGQLKYLVDAPALENEAHAAFVTARAPRGCKIIDVQTSEALKYNGVIAYYGVEDIPGKNVLTPLDPSGFYTVEEQLFCNKIVQYYNQPIGIIVAKTEELAWKAAKMVAVYYEFSYPSEKNYCDIRKVLEDKIESRITYISSIIPEERGEDIKKIVKGDFYIGMQYHYHMELQCAKVVPLDDGGIDIFTTTQWMDSNQIAAASVLNMPKNKINVKVSQLGGSFGAKILRNIFVSTAAALAAVKLQIPIKMNLPMENNMQILGKRYPLFMKYEAGVNEKGVIQYLEADLYSDYGVGGNEPIDSLMVSSFENCYNTRTWEFCTYSVQTDLPANCYTRAPGTLEGTAAIENIMEHIAFDLKLDPETVKLANTNKQSSVDILDYWTDLKSWADINKQKDDIKTFNQANRWTKRGLSIVPMKWTLEVGANNYSVVVSIFHGDGSVAISHGGIEDGQGINTKVIQVCAQKLGIDESKISVKQNCNLTSSNSSSTGVSFASEAICYAVFTACATLLERMMPVKVKMENPTWVELVNACFAEQIQLVATGFFNGREIKSYPIFGICAASVEVDILTGNHQILEVDIIEDVGQSMNPFIDVGQIEGAFVMGIGYYTTEELEYNSDGKLFTDRTWNYKPPGAKDIPIKFRIKFTENSKNPASFFLSKAVSEPPICLSVAVPLAIRDALASARYEADPSSNSWIPFDGPTTVERTFVSSGNQYKEYVLK